MLKVGSIRGPQGVTFRSLSVVKRFNQFKTPFLEKKRLANHHPLSIISFLNASALHYPTRVAYVHGDQAPVTWHQLSKRVRRLSSALSSLGIKDGDVVSIIAPNTPAIFEAHFAIPGCRGAVIHTINTRLDPTTIAFQLNHCKAKVVLVDAEFGKLIKDAIDLLPKDALKPIVVDILDPEYVRLHQSPSTIVQCGDGRLTYEDLIEKGDENAILAHPIDEWDAIGLSYTSGTTGNPKGVVHHHRGAYLNALSNVVELNMPRFSKYLWIVPMFHCNGWCFAWSMASIAGTSYFLRQIRADAIFDMIKKYQIGFIGGAPITMITMLGYPGKFKFEHTVHMMTAGAPPPPPVIKRFQAEIGIAVQCAYGLTETYGPIAIHNDDDTWLQRGLSEEEILNKCTYLNKYAIQEDLAVFHPENVTCVPADGKTIGEVFTRGNITMKGYLANEIATEETFAGGWFRTGDLGVQHPNGRIEIKDRSKDIIISGGENISSIEVETILMKHPLIAEVAVIAMSDEKWGEVPCAFIKLQPNSNISGEEIIKWARNHMAHFQAPKKVVFGELPKTSTGKVLKQELRKLLKS